MQDVVRKLKVNLKNRKRIKGKIFSKSYDNLDDLEPGELFRGTSDGNISDPPPVSPDLGFPPSPDQVEPSDSDSSSSGSIGLRTMGDLSSDEAGHATANDSKSSDPISETNASLIDIDGQPPDLVAEPKAEEDQISIHMTPYGREVGTMTSLKGNNIVVMTEEASGPPQYGFYLLDKLLDSNNESENIKTLRNILKKFLDESTASCDAESSRDNNGDGAVTNFENEEIEANQSQDDTDGATTERTDTDGASAKNCEEVNISFAEIDGKNSENKKIKITGDSKNINIKIKTCCRCAESVALETDRVNMEMGRFLIEQKRLRIEEELLNMIKGLGKDTKTDILNVFHEGQHSTIETKDQVPTDS